MLLQCSNQPFQSDNRHSDHEYQPSSNLHMDTINIAGNRSIQYRWVGVKGNSDLQTYTDRCIIRSAKPGKIQQMCQRSFWEVNHNGVSTSGSSTSRVVPRSLPGRKERWPSRLTTRSIMPCKP